MAVRRPALNLRPGDITGVVLAGGLGRRMGGVDKGLQLLNGTPLAQLALQRLAPQVGPLAVNANRHADAYAAFGVPVWPDDLPAGVASHPGPLAGWLAALEHCGTPWLVTVPCDTPHFPGDLVARLAAALAEAGADIAMAATHHGTALRAQPVFCLLAATLAPRLRQDLLAGQRQVEAWALRQNHVLVPFADSGAFFNANTAQDLQALQR